MKQGLKCIGRIGQLLTVMTAAITLLGCAEAVVVGAGAGATSAQDSRSFGTQIDDENIENRAMSAMRNRADILEQSHVEVVSYNRIVLLLGQTPTQTYKTALANLVAEVPNVRKVYNEIRVAGPRSTLTAMGDSTITTKIKASLLTESDFPSGKVKVVTENGEVFLMGLVTRDQGARATDIARSTGDVSKVIQLFEYVEPTPAAN